jgi:hypothetical protein
MSDLCVYEGCTAVAVCAVEAQWTLLDFVEYALCDTHQLEAVETLETRLVEGYPPIDVRTVWWEMSDL